MATPVPSYDPTSGRRLDGSWPGDPAPLALAGAGDLLDRAEVRFVSAAEWRCPPGWRVPRRRLATANFSYYLAGTAVISTDDGPLHAQAGDFVLLPPGLGHGVRQDPADRVHGLSGHFTARSAGGLDLIALLGIPRLVRTMPGRDDPLVELPRQLARDAAIRPPGWQSASTARIRLILDHLIRVHGPACTPPPGPPAAAARLRPMLELIAARSDDPELGVGEMARAAGVSTVRLRTLCRQHLGCAPLAWLHQRRMAEACRLLATGDQSIAAVARQVGFADPVWFHRLFRRTTGMTPGAWRSGRA